MKFTTEKESQEFETVEIESVGDGLIVTLGDDAQVEMTVMEARMFVSLLGHYCGDWDDSDEEEN